MPTSEVTGTKILIVMIKDGGEDSTHRFLRRDTALNDQILVSRPSAGLGFSNAEIAGYTGGHLDADWCLHPSLFSGAANLKTVWDAGDMAITHLVGPMFTDLSALTTPQVRQATYSGHGTGIILPIDLAAHDSQQYTMASMVTRDFTDGSTNWTTTGNGFLGRLAQLFGPYVREAGSNANMPATLPITFCAGLRGTARNLIGMYELTRPLDIPVTGFGKFNSAFYTSASQTEAINRLTNIMALSVGETRQDIYRSVHQGTVNAIGVFQPIVEDAHGTMTVDASFVNTPTGWNGIMRTFARMIERRATGATGLPKRMILVGNYGSYDTHSGQGKTTGSLPTLFADESNAVAAFRAAMLALDGSGALWDSVVITDYSEFSRTLTANGAAGTDHAYARTFSTFGGVVRGNGVDGSTGHFGTAPTDYSIYGGGNVAPWTGGGSHDINGEAVGRGALRPVVSWEQYWTEILEWFGANATDLNLALPRRSAMAGASPNLIA